MRKARTEGTFFGLIGMIVITASGTVFAQQPKKPANAQLEQQEYERRRAEFTKGPTTSAADITTVTVTNKFSIVGALSIEATNRLTVTEDDRLAYADFLKRPNTGIFKLLNLPNCNGKGQKCLIGYFGIFDKANSYSFRSNKHIFVFASDLTLKKDALVTGPAFAFSFMTSLGDAFMDDLSTETDKV